MARATPKKPPEARVEAPIEDWAAATEKQILDQALKLVPHGGWTWRMAKQAGKAAGLSAGETELLLPQGPADLAALLSRRHDAKALEALAALDPGSLKIRERIARGVAARIDAALVDEVAVRRLNGWFSLPQNMALGARLAWETADKIWRWAGDTATDENHYSKRVLLAGILTGALAIRMSDGRKAALAFVDRRIDDVMRYEKWKATGGFRPGDWLTGAAHALGRMRYGARPE
jgi:ubiquinone biosynthesis protein COQ9